mmetsp:Transcript_13082/g.26762  ORF Transcript_13082/g.26762 Transcript_13082/m.26762 type:complete len:235 (-) Transcript_13082:16-720(-)
MQYTFPSGWTPSFSSAAGFPPPPDAFFAVSLPSPSPFFFALLLLLPSSSNRVMKIYPPDNLAHRLGNTMPASSSPRPTSPTSPLAASQCMTVASLGGGSGMLGKSMMRGTSSRGWRGRISRCSCFSSLELELGGWCSIMLVLMMESWGRKRGMWGGALGSGLWRIRSLMEDMVVVGVVLWSYLDRRLSVCVCVCVCWLAILIYCLVMIFRGTSLLGADVEGRHCRRRCRCRRRS